MATRSLLLATLIILILFNAGFTSFIGISKLKNVATGWIVNMDSERSRLGFYRDDIRGLYCSEVSEQ